MKHTKAVVFSIILCAALGMQAVQAAIVSPALEHLAADSAMIKTGNHYTGITFSAEDFRNASGLRKVDSVTITSLPAISAGTLYLGNVPVAVNQSISGEGLNSIRFVPEADTESGSFCFTVNNDYSLMCQLKITDEVNFAPQAASYEEVMAAWTQKGISCYGTLDAYDPENDALSFEIVQYPQKGLLILQDKAHGDFKYTPYVGCSGSDFFTYRVRDSYGNYSDTARANVMISRKSSKIVFADMNEHWAHSAAIEMASAGIMNYDTASGMPVFNPDQKVTREEFLVMAMRTLGYTPKDSVEKTVFSDDSEISPKNRAYVSAAYHAGIIKGREVDGQLCFCPSDAITRAETAVIMNNIIGGEVPVNVSLFADNDTVPAWAQSAMYALNELGILKGTGAGAISPDAAITRAQAAQILFNFSQYIA